jgi:molybdenum cofactor guanylyltransferase
MDESQPEQATGAILAGGASRRMGRDKAGLVLDGETLLARAVRRLRPVVREVIVVGPPERSLLVPDVRVVPDDRPGQGPLGGVYTALGAASTDRVFVMACDMPFVQTDLVRCLLSLAGAYDIVVPRSERGTEQLHAVYMRACLPAVAACLDTGALAIASLYSHARTYVMEPDEWAVYDPLHLSLVNVNTPEEWEAARTRAARD